MALDLSDPSLHAAYEDLLRPEGATDWCVLLISEPRPTEC